MMRSILAIACATILVLPGSRCEAEGWTLSAVGWAVLSGVLSYEGAAAWKRFRHIPNEQELQRQTVRELAAAIGEKLEEQRLGQAQSYFLNAHRELRYYLNNPPENKNSLDEARTQSGFSLNEFKQMGAQALEPYALCAILHMAVLQEKLKISRNAAAEEKNIALHIDETREYIDSAKEKIIAHYKWDTETLIRPQDPPRIGTLAILIPDPKEVRARQGVVDTQLVALAFEKPEEAFPILQKRIAGLVKSGNIDTKTVKGLSSQPISVGSLAIKIR